MGRRIYESGEFVYKYAFAEQNSELCDLDNKYNIGAHYDKRVRDENDHEFVYTQPIYELNASEIPKLHKLLDHLRGGYSKAELHEIGMGAVIDFINKQSPEWKKAWDSGFRAESGNLELFINSKSVDDWPSWGGSMSGFRFEPHHIYVKAIKEKTHLLEDINFIAMVEAIVEHIGDDIRDYEFHDEY